MEKNTLMDLSNLQMVLEDYAKDAERLFKEKLSDGGKNASRSLSDSARAYVVVGEDAYEVVMNLQEYWKFVERGRKGTETSPARVNVGTLPSYVPQSTQTELLNPMGSPAFPPVDALIQWIKVKPVIPRPDKRGRIPSPNSLAYLIGRKIERHGIDPHPTLATTIQELDAMYNERISEALGRDIGLYIRKLVANK